MVTKQRAAEAVRAMPGSSKEKGALLFLLDNRSDQELAKWLIQDKDDDETIWTFILAKAQGAAAGQGVGRATEGVVLEKLEEIKQQNQDIQQQNQDIQQFLSIVFQGQFKATSSDTGRDGKIYRKNALAFYGYDASAEEVQCMVTGKFTPCANIRAGHIFRQGWNTAVLPLLGIDSVHDPRNIILVRKEVEAAFDRFEFTIMPQSSGEGAQERLFEIHVLKPSLLTGQQQYIGTGNAESDDTKWVDVHKSHLHVEGDNLPARRLLAMHALLAIKHATIQGWLKPGELTVPEAGWASPDYDSALMRKYLADAAAATGSESQQQEESQQQDWEQDS